ncbi:MAG: helix-turn-helix transcriptional regulator [Acidobacteria bacterium]|nr:helix-turn-helix transcriptional regulator [Acidobacteriota bacterium]
MSRKSRSTRRSECPVSVALEIVGDRWSLIIVRDLMVRSLKTFKEFRQAGEGIATNILADRLETLKANGIIAVERDDRDRRRVNYRLTQKGIALAPVLLELLIWGARHGPTTASCLRVEEITKNRNGILAEVERRWRERDPRPLLPRLQDFDIGRAVERQRPGTGRERVRE